MRDLSKGIRLIHELGELTAAEKLLHRCDHCLLYTSDAADERSSVDLGGRRIIKKKNNTESIGTLVIKTQTRTAHTTRLMR